MSEEILILYTKGVFIVKNTSLVLMLMLVLTGLAFSQNENRFTTLGEVITDTVTGLEWRVGPDTDTDWYAARDWVMNIGGDWRLPTEDELFGLVRAGINSENWGPFETSEAIVWSGDLHDDNSSAFCFIFSTGSLMPVFSNFDYSGNKRVFAVRGEGQEVVVPAGRFTTLGEVITDTATGLEWRVGPDTDTDWYAARDWVMNLGGDWRLPTIIEFKTLYTAGITLDNFGPFENGGIAVWSNKVQYSTTAWRFAFWTGLSGDSIKPCDYSYSTRVFAVRSQ